MNKRSLLQTKTNIWALALIFLTSLACEMQPSANTAAASTEATETPNPEVPVVDSAQAQQSRGLDPQSNLRLSEFDFSSAFPGLYELIKGDAALLGEVSAYAQQVENKENLSSEADLMSLFQIREQTIVPNLSPTFENLDLEPSSEKWEVYTDELSRLGIAITGAEGIVTGLTVSPVLQEEVKNLGSQAFQHYLAFIYADAKTLSGEYPFSNMSPYKEMIVRGEQLQKLQPNAYFEKVEKRFDEALQYFTDIHLVNDPTARQKTVLVGAANTEMYPFATETETAAEFAKDGSGSQYQELVSKILSNTSEISTRPENIYVVVIEWATSEDMARNRVHTYLRKGTDIPHYLQIRRGDGTDQFAVSYRFYESADKADEALEKIKVDYPDAQLVMCSVKGEKLYQLGI